MKQPSEQAKVIDEVRELVKAAYPNDTKNLDLSNDHIKLILELFLERIDNLKQLTTEEFSYLWFAPQNRKHDLPKGETNRLF